MKSLEDLHHDSWVCVLVWCRLWDEGDTLLGVVVEASVDEEYGRTSEVRSQK